MVYRPQGLSEWQFRARGLGLKQRTIAALLGASEEWVSRQIRSPKPAQRIITIIATWEILTPQQRGELLFRVGLGRLAWRQRVVSAGQDQSVSAPAWPARNRPKLDPWFRSLP